MGPVETPSAERATMDLLFQGGVEFPTGGESAGRLCPGVGHGVRAHIRRAREPVWRWVASGPIR